MKAVQMIPIAEIRVINPRHRNKAKFNEIVENISTIGLKRPITVSRRIGENGYDLVCGQGRLEAYAALGQTQVPALVVEATKEDRLLMSLVENVARRTPTPLEFVRSISILKERGYSLTEIAAKTAVSGAYVHGVLRLLQHGEHRLLEAVERGEIPVAVAVEIASSDDASVQRSLTQAYESGQLRGRSLKVARQIVEQRRSKGKRKSKPRPGKKSMSAEELVRTYRKEAERQRVLVKKARFCERRLRFLTSAFAELLADENFVNLLRAEKLETLPKPLEERIKDQSS